MTRTQIMVAAKAPRLCLTCQAEFKPTGRFNRICGPCSRKAVFRSGIREVRVPAESLADIQAQLV